MIKQILDNALRGNGITLNEANIIMNSSPDDLGEIMQTAKALTARNFGNKVEMCAIFAAKVGLCSGDCAYCAQSVHHNCNVTPIEVNMLNEDEIISNARELSQLGVSRYSLVTSGERLTDAEFDRLLCIFRRLNSETSMDLCASFGSLTVERADKLKEAGVSRYHHNLETDRSYFPVICSTHSYDDKILTINIARQAGMEICSGGIIAMGETPEQRVEMAFALKTLDVDCIPINILNPIKGTRFEYQHPLQVNEILRIIAMFRLVLPNKPLRFAGGREKALGKDEYLGYNAGMNAMIVGNYLTTSGKSIEEEIKNLKIMGYTIE